jgi:pyruvate dehydrogenase kinase 2/3/4
LQQFLQAEVTHFAAMQRSKLTLEDLLRAASSPHRAAEKVHEEIPKHFAARLRQIEALKGWKEDQDLFALWNIYFQSFEEMRMCDVEDNLEPFTAVVRKLKERQRRALPHLGQALHRRWTAEGSSFTNEWMVKFLESRIGTEMLTSQYIAIINQVQQGKKKITGIVDPVVSPEDICRSAAEAARQLCETHMGMAPEINIDVRVKRSRAGDVSFSYIPIYLRYILVEVLKNSCQATVRTMYTSLCAEQDMRPVNIVICSDDYRVAIRISDRAGGIPFDVGERVWDFGFTGQSESNAADPSQATALGGFGLGLPLARLYARYLGGSLSLVSLPEYGVDTYLFLPRVDAMQCMQSFEEAEEAPPGDAWGAALQAGSKSSQATAK